jgi:putative DNA primase/helicase
MSNTTFVNYERTKGTDGISSDKQGPAGSLNKNMGGTEGIYGPTVEVISPVEVFEAVLNSPKIERPTYVTHDDWFRIGGKKFKPGLYYHGIDKPDSDDPVHTDTWICSPIHADALTSNEHGADWGLLLRFINPDGKWREWAMPSYMLKGHGDEMRGELLSLGVRISPDGNKLLHRWLASRDPKSRIIAAMRTGWHDSPQGIAFVLPNKVIGADNVRFQSEYAVHDDFIQKGTLEDWKKEVAALCQGNHILLLSVSSALAGPLLKIAKLQELGGAGIHLMGDSSRGKTTSLQVAASVWGSPSFMRTWRATANGLEGTAASRNDTFLPLDECGESDPKEIGLIIYSLANGVGKQRAKRTGGTRESARWRTIVLSSGECAMGTHMSESGKRIKAGQQARLLDIPATNFEFGAFNYLHGSDSGRAFADRLKRATSKNYGHLGVTFVEKLIADKQNLPALYADTCKLPKFSTNNGVESRAVGTFALIGMAGELATEYGLTGWKEGDAINAAITAFQSWRKYRGTGKTEDRQILQAVRDFILQHGDSRFSKLGNSTSENLHIKNRAGWWKESDIDERVYLFHAPALREAVPGFEITKILDVLQKAGWITEHDKDKRSKKTTVNGSKTNFYYIRPNEDDGL